MKLQLNIIVLKYFFSFVLLFSIVNVFGEKFYDDGKKPNIVFIFVDDLRPDLGCYGNSVVQSPNLDQFSQESVLFKSQYATVPTCGASRLSLLRGKLPRTIFELSNDAAEMLADSITSVPQTFIEELRNNGYFTIGIGKVSHSADGYVYPYSGPKTSQHELPNAWDELLFDYGKWSTGWNAFFGYQNGKSRITENGNVAPFEAGATDDQGYPDGLIAALAVNKIQDISRQNKPFFLGIGFFKPHLPFNAPQKYWNLYNEKDIPLSITPNAPENVSLLSLHNSGEINQYKLIEHPVSLKSPLSNEYSQKLIHGYYASISYIDVQVGKVIDALKKEGVYDNTIIVVWGDHGWHLGDYGLWGKHTLFENSLKSVLMIKPPNYSGSKVIEKIVSAVDVAPTVLSLAGVETSIHFDGKSMEKLIFDKTDKQWRNVAYSYFNNGISVVTNRYRFNKYFKSRSSEIELFDHREDPNETRNVANLYPKVVREMEALIERGNTGLYE